MKETNTILKKTQKLVNEAFLCKFSRSTIISFTKNLYITKARINLEQIGKDPNINNMNMHKAH